MADKKNLIIDLIALVVYVVVANPLWTGIGLHEWISLGIFMIIFIHVLLHGDWLLESAKSAFKNPSFARTGNFILDLLLVLVLMLCTFSGIFVSGEVLPALGYFADGYFFWDPLHAFSAKLLLAILIIHLVVHWKWFVSVFRSKKESSHE